MVDVAGSIGSAVSPILEVGKWLAFPIWRQFKYLYNYTTNLKNLEEEVKKLKNTKEEVQHKVDAAERNVEKIKQNVKDWQNGVEKTMIEAEKLIKEKENNPRCFNGLCPNFVIHYKHSKKSFKLKQNEIDPLLQQEKELGPVSFPTTLPEIWLRSNEDYLAFKSRNSTVNNVWDALNDENVYMIGVYGMGGIGKTTLVQELGRKAEKDKLFEEIVFVEVTESPDRKKIQTVIADNLGLKFENEREMTKKLFSRMKDKNILLIVDNIWEPLDLTTTFGIAFGAACGRNKLLLTTRNLDVLDRMGSTKNFRMGILNEEEAWILFTKMTGNVIRTRELHSLPNDVCKECGGLPIIICTMAKALKNKSHPSVWKVALQELRAPSPTKFTRFLGKEYAKIALSYEYLRDDELKKTFLISSLLGNNSSISELFRHVVCLDILEGTNLTMEDARDRLDKLVRDLKDACLLFDGLRSEQFAMHDVIRDVALTIAYVDHHVFTMRNDIEREWKEGDKLKKCTKISSPYSSIIISQLLPNDLGCPNLEYFYMWNSLFKNSCFNIPEGFFIVMPKLKVLNLFGLQQSSLPSSIDLLTNLQTLCLDYSKVKDFTIIGRLKTLKVLSLQNSVIEEFPIEMGQLTQLRLLDLSNCWKLEGMPTNVISQLSQLEDFFLKGCPIKWKYEVLAELKLLSKLTSLELDIKDNNALPRDFFSKELKRYKISVGDWFFRYPIKSNLVENLRILKFQSNSTVSLEEICGIKNVEVLCIAKSSNDAKDLDETLMRPLFNEKINSNLKVFEWIDGREKRRICWQSQSKTLTICNTNIPIGLLKRFYNLKQLELFEIQNKEIKGLFDLRDLEVLHVLSCHRLMSLLSFSASFQNLKVLNICSYHGLVMKLITPSMAKSLVQLREMSIHYSETFTEIVEYEGDATTLEIVFDNLNKLSLTNLENLICFCSGNYSFSFPSLERLIIERCPNMKIFSPGSLSTPKLHNVYYEKKLVEIGEND